MVQATFLWQGDNLLAETRRDGDGEAGCRGVACHALVIPGLDNLHAVVVNNERLYGHADGLGNVIALTDEAQGGAPGVRV